MRNEPSLVAHNCEEPVVVYHSGNKWPPDAGGANSGGTGWIEAPDASERIKKSSSSLIPP